MSSTRPRALATIDLAAVTHNAARLREITGTPLMAMVKANGYGHGAVPVARAALAGGAEWLGVATVDEGLELRAAGVSAPILVLLLTGGDAIEDAIAGGLEVSAGSLEALAEITLAAGRVGTIANVQLEFDTGLGRGGVPTEQWRELLNAAGAQPHVRVTGLWSHFASADEPDATSVTEQLAAFRQVLSLRSDDTSSPLVRHMSNSAGALGVPAARLDLIRPGIALYGITPAPQLGDETELGLRPAMTLTSFVADVKNVPAGHGVSYGHEYRTAQATRLALIPVGYADAVPRSGKNRIEVAIHGRRYRAAGRISMDQFVIDVGSDPVSRGDTVHLFGPGEHGEATAREFASSCGTIAYEIFTGLGRRVVREWR